MPQTILAIQGKYDFVIKTNPFGAKPKPDSKKEKASKDMLEKNKALALKFDLMALKAKQETQAK